jgi:hypothetical protein
MTLNIYLLAKTCPNINAIKELFDSEEMDFLGDATGSHTFWCLAMPLSQKLLVAILDSGAGCVSFTQDWLFVSGSTKHWHTIARHILKHDVLSIRKFGTFLIQTYPEIFNELPVTSNPDGTLVPYG